MAPSLRSRQKTETPAPAKGSAVKKSAAKVMLTKLATPIKSLANETIIKTKAGRAQPSKLASPIDSKANETVVLKTKAAKKAMPRTKRDKPILQEKPIAQAPPEDPEPDPQTKQEMEVDDTSVNEEDKKVVGNGDTTFSKLDEINFSELELTRTIDDSADSKRIVFLGRYNGQEAVVRLEKTAFNEEATKKALCDKATTFRRDFINDIYSSYIINPDSSLNEIKATVVWPATEAAITKYSRSEMIFFCETPDVYAKVVKPHIDSVVESDTDPNRWIYNILEGKTETERVIMNDPNPESGFILIPDLKWLGEEKDLHYVAICHRRDIRSLRDLTDKHLVLLKNISMKGTKAIKDKYKMTNSQLRTFIHYQPSFYHFHVHFKLVDAAGYASTDRDNLLGTVISNITLKKDYYKKASLTYPLSKSHALYQELKNADKLHCWIKLAILWVILLIAITPKFLTMAYQDCIWQRDCHSIRHHWLIVSKIRIDNYISYQERTNKMFS